MPTHPSVLLSKTRSPIEKHADHVVSMWNGLIRWNAGLASRHGGSRGHGAKGIGKRNSITGGIH